jgi:hypothetical protein
VLAEAAPQPTRLGEAVQQYHRWPRSAQLNMEGHAA